MPPGETGQSLVVIVFNDHRKARDFELSVSPPTGTTFTKGKVERTKVDGKTFEIGIEMEDAPGVTPGGATFKLSLPGRSAWKTTLPLTGKIVAKPEVERRQFFSETILQPVAPGQPLKLNVKLDAAAMKQAKRAWARLVVEDIDTGEATMKLGRKTTKLPKTLTPDNVCRIVELPLEPGDLAETMEFEFTVNPGNHAGYRVDMVSVVLESR
jgi:hypothetical protein